MKRRTKRGSVWLGDSSLDNLHRWRDEAFRAWDRLTPKQQERIARDSHFDSFVMGYQTACSMNR